MRSIPIPMIVWLPALVWFVTYELTKFHGIKGWLKENTDFYRDWETDRKSTRLNSSHSAKSRMPSSA